METENQPEKNPSTGSGQGGEMSGGSIWSVVWETLRYALIAALIIIPIRTFIAQPFVVSGNSMYPTFHNGEYLIVNELAKYRYRSGGHYAPKAVIRAPYGSGVRGGLWNVMINLKDIKDTAFNDAMRARCGTLLQEAEALMAAVGCEGDARLVAMIEAKAKKGA